MRISILGLGYVGLTGAACLIDQGYDVIGVDINEYKISELNNGKCPINEPGVEELLQKGLAEGRFRATTNTFEAVSSSNLSFVCVGTPSGASGAHDMSFIVNVSKQIVEAIKVVAKEEPLFKQEVVYRSTMSPGSIHNLIAPIFETIGNGTQGKNWEIFYNPEFLRESTAIKDYYNPPKIVIGHRQGADTATIDSIYENIKCEKFHVGIRESEITKFLDNSFHALKVAYGNEIGRLCKTLDVNTDEVMEIFLADTKLNISSLYLTPGGAFGGSCLPKDVRALNWLANSNGVKSEIISNIINSNESHKEFIANYVEGFIPAGSKVLVVGLSFKSNTDDLRESPQIDVIQKLIGRGYPLRVYDPDIEFSNIHGKNLAFTYANIPHLESYLIDDAELKTESFDKVIITKNIPIPVEFDEKDLIRIDKL